MSKTILLPYQRRWVADQARFKVGMFSRQTGKTFSTTLEATLDCQAAEAAGHRTAWVILSRGERQSKEAMREGVERHAHALGASIRAVESKWTGDATHTALEAIWPGGSRITALPANPDTARGFARNVLLDEFGIHRDSREIWAALFPVISAGFKIRVVSTPKGKSNKFYDLMSSGRVAHASATWLSSAAGLGALDRAGDVWSRHVVDIYQAVEDGLQRDIDGLRDGLGDDEAWRQEFELQWLDEAGAWLPYELIDGAEDPAAGDPLGYQDGPCWIGMDIAARGDLTVLWVLERVGDVLWARERVELARAPFAVQLAELDRLMRSYRVIAAALDQTGMGEAVLEQAQRAHGSRIHGVLFSGASKLDMATRLKDHLEDRRLRLPQGDRPLRADLHSVQRQMGPTGIPRLIAERSGGSHADRFWAIALAVTVADQGGGEIAWTPCPARRSGMVTGQWDRPDSEIADMYPNHRALV